MTDTDGGGVPITRSVRNRINSLSKVESQVLSRLAVAFSLLLISAVGGCRSVQTAMTEQWQADAGNSQAESQTQPAADDEATLVHFEEPESLLLPIVDVSSEQTALTLADLEEIAFQNNPTLAAAAARMESARGRQLQAGLYPNPVVGYHATEVGNLGTAGQQGAFISQRFITAGKLQLDQEIAGKEIDAAHFQFHAQEQRVLSDVRVRFYDVLVAQRRVELTKELVGIGDNLVEAANTLLAGRQGTLNDKLQAQIRADEAHILYDNARNQTAEAWRRLAAIIGLPTMQRKPLVGQLDVDLPSYAWDDCHAMVLDSNPQLNAARARADRAGIAIHRATKEPIPNIDVSVSVRHIYPTDSDVANIQIGIPIPIFDKNQGNIRSAEAEWIAANNEVQRIELDLQDRLAVAYRRFANSRQQADRYSQKMVPRAKQSLELVTDGYDKGQVNYLTMLIAQQTYVQVSLSYLDSLRELRTSAAVIEGQLLTDSLKGSR
jgi:cobalt-zinc-cadmium efflux system outer membrane protein